MRLLKVDLGRKRQTLHRQPRNERPGHPKTPVEVVLEQITKQEKKVGELREELKKEESNLTRLNQAKKVLEAT